MVTLIPLSCVGIFPLANSGALLQSTPVDGVFAGTRFVPLIWSHVLYATRGRPKAAFTTVMTGAPAAPVVNVPLTCIVGGLFCKWGLITNDPVTPAYAPVPSATVP